MKVRPGEGDNMVETKKEIKTAAKRSTKADCAKGEPEDKITPKKIQQAQDISKVQKNW